MSLHATTLFPKVSLLQGIGIASLITDESYGVLMGEAVHHQAIPVNWMHGNNIFSYLVWILSTVVGALIGNLIPNPEALGLDFALLAMFLELLIFQFEAMLSHGLKKLVTVLIAVLLAYLLLACLVTDSVAVLLATLIGCSVGVLQDDK